MDQPIILFIKLTPKPEFRDALKNAIAKVVPLALSDARCKAFQLHKSAVDGDHSLYLYEFFENQDAYNHYAQQRYTQELREIMKEYLGEPIQLTKLSQLA